MVSEFLEQLSRALALSVGPRLVFFRERHVILDRPVDGEGRIVPTDAALGFRMIKFADQIRDLGAVGERLVAVGTAGWNIEHAAVVLVDGYSVPKSVGGGVRTHVDDHLVDFAARTAEEFCFSVRRRLPVESADSSAFFAGGNIDLDKGRRDSLRLKFFLAKHARKKSAVIRARFRIYEEGSVDRGWRKLHAVQRLVNQVFLRVSSLSRRR